jgi:mycobactin phenyloxazoline synthetase
VSADEIRAEIAELLGVGADAVDSGADLVGQGLDSIRMMALAGRWRQQGIGIEFAALAADPRIDAWSALLDKATAPAASLPQSAEFAETADVDAPFPLAPMQHAMWVGRQDNQPLGGVAGHLYVEFDGAGIDPQRLTAAAADLAVRHPMLRVQFLPDGTQRIGPPTLGIPVAVEDLRECDPAAVENRLAQLRGDKSRQHLDGQVVELTLSRLPGARTRLHVDLDMQAADAMSYRTLLADLAALYSGAVLPELGYSYRQYRQALTRAPEAPQPGRDAAYQWWAERIPELPDAPRLPMAPSGRAAPTSSRRWHWLDPRTRDVLFARSRARGLTPAMTLAAVFAHSLACWSADPRFLLNVPLFGREPLHPDVDRLVGDFTSSLLLDVDFTHADTAAQRGRIVQDAMRLAAAHAAYPGLSVLRDLGRHRGTQVLAPVVFTSALGLGELFSADVTEVFGRPGWIISQGPQVLLDAQVTEFDGGVLINWDVRDDAFAPGVVDAMFDHHLGELIRLVEDDATAWETTVSAAVPAPQAEVRERINARVATPSGDRLHDGFLRRAAEYPDAPAVYCDSGDLTYSQLRDRSLAVAAALRDAGVAPGDTVAILGPKNAEQIAAVLGVLAAGAAYLPIGVDHPADRAARMLAAGGVRAALITGECPPALTVPALTVTDAARHRGDGAGVAATGPDALAYVLFTSGSTGEPKGVEISHDAAMNTVEFINTHFEIGAHDRCLALATLEFDMSVLDVFGTLRAGGAIVVVDEARRRDPDHWARAIDTHAVTVLNFLPGWLQMLLEVTGDAPRSLSSLRVVPTGGDWVNPELVHRLRGRAPSVRFAGLGGATETAIHHSVCEVSEPPAEWTAVPMGTPLPNTRCRVVGARGDCPDWVPGELWVAGRGLARGYRGRPDLTGQRFTDDRGATWYRTGDLVRYRPDGFIEFVGRLDHRVKISGYRVELGDVEAALHRIPGVHTAVAAAVTTTGGAQLLAAVVRAENPAPSAAQLRAEMTGLVPEHMIPRHIELVDRIPYTLLGKIDRRAVAADLTAATGDPAPAHRAPSGPLETALTAILAELLGVPVIGADDDFFSLGGDSVLATSAIARIRTWLDVPGATVADVFAARTAATLAERLTRQEPEPDRLDGVAEVYLEVAGMNSAEVASEIAAR